MDLVGVGYGDDTVEVYSGHAYRGPMSNVTSKESALGWKLAQTFVAVIGITVSFR